MRKSVVPILAIAGLALAACGGSDGESSGLQAEAAQQTIDAAKDAGFALDENCVNDITSQLSNDDAEAIVAAGPTGIPEVSDEGSALAQQLATCLGQEALLDQFIIGMRAEGQAFDEGCVREKLKEFDLGTLAAQGENADIPNEMVAALIECFDN
ncbi:MAG: hypothetical protein DRJ50_03385 [Actinobacteria bacterium]|nr:MAG: hypothetical protein DRJ50_03385 [Actinomycetota bacterium]